MSTPYAAEITATWMPKTPRSSPRATASFSGAMGVGQSDVLEVGRRCEREVRVAGVEGAAEAAVGGAL
jgi:hypothetical protein